jgi:hypothetical protein
LGAGPEFAYVSCSIRLDTVATSDLSEAASQPETIVKTTLLTLIALILALPLLAQQPDPAAYDRLLVPIAPNIQPVPGAFGSQWSTQLLLRNATASQVRLRGPICPPVFILAPCGPELVLEPDSVFTAYAAPNRGVAGVFIYVPKLVAASVPMSLRIRDLSRQLETAGTSIPIVRQSEFRNHLELLDIPIASKVMVLPPINAPDLRFRATLRVYAADSTPVPVRLRIYPLEGNSETPLVDTRLQLLGIVSIADILFPTVPGFAQVGSLSDQYPEIPGGRVRLVIDTELPESTPIWAFVSLTSNATQHVTIVAP